MGAKFSRSIGISRRAAAIAAVLLLALLLWGAAAAQEPAGAEPGPAVVKLLAEGPKLTAEDEEAAGRFGRSVALSADGSTAIVGGPRESAKIGAAWIFTRSGTDWSEQAKLEVPESDGFFGRAVAISADGDTVVIGDPGNAGSPGSAWVFTRSGSTWSLEAHLAGAEEVGAGRFGRSVALSADGETALVGAFADGGKAGAAWVFTDSGSSGWTQQGPKLTGGGESGPGFFGRSVALSADGSSALIGGNEDNAGAGAAWVFTRSGATWSQQGPKLTGAEESGTGEFGSAVALSGAGDVGLVGGAGDSHGRGAGWVFTRSGSTWSQQGRKLTPEDAHGRALLGFSAALSADGTLALLGGYGDAEQAGGAWLFEPVSGGWSQAAPELTGAGEVGAGNFGISVALAGTRALIGGNLDASETGAAWPFAAPVESEEPEPEKEEEREETKTSTNTPLLEDQLPPGQLDVLGTVINHTPVLTQTGNIAPVSGKVLVRLPHTDKFVPLTELRTVPFGTIVDATAGHVTVTAALPGGGDESGEFFGGQFLLTQRKNGVVLVTLAGGQGVSCPAHAHHADVSATHKKRKLWSNAHGTYTTKGSYAAGAVQGTEWLTEDRCDGTLIRVTRDKVKVTDLVRHRTFIVRAGHKLLVKP
jgi:hypothetical protein